MRNSVRWNVLAVVLALTVCRAELVVSAGERPVSYQHDVRPIFVRHCQRCHGTRNQEADLQLNRRSSVLLDRDEGEAVVIPGHASGSLLLHRLVDESAGDLMPLDGDPLNPEELDVLRRWIDAGADWPDEFADAGHWAWEAVSRPALPQPQSDLGAIDQFVRRRLEQESAAPTHRLDRPRLIRRTSLALTGLPPTPAEISAFETDATGDAYETVVDRLLASPHYGERWAVPWMDVARYADSNGFQADQLRDNWAWRDWVIRAFNADMPFDRFVTEQLAGDLIPNATADQKIATGFHRMTTCNVEAGVHPEANRVNQIVDRVNTTATAFLGVTLECAQCHDHKYDPFTQEDYYRLFAYFNNSPLEVKQTSGVTWDFYGPVMPLPQTAQQRAQVTEWTGRMADLRARHEQLLEEEQSGLKKWINALCETQPEASEMDRKLTAAALAETPNAQQSLLLRQQFVAQHPQLSAMQTEIDALEVRLAEADPGTTLVMVEMEAPRDTFILTRGDYDQPADRVVAGTPRLWSGGDEQSGTGDRLELAGWLTSASNPLFARVTVNRWWGELLGTGLVSTPEDFGTQADAPSHPQLLDWLAAEFMSGGWSMKHIHKLIVMSEVWQQEAAGTPDMRRRDPANRLLARGPRFRMPAELLRDNALAISGLLSTEMYGPPVMPWQPSNVWRSVGRNQPKWSAAEDQNRFRRGVYVVFKRAAPYPSFVTFDAPDRGTCAVQRTRSNTPLQALTLQNDRAYTELALAFADRVLTETPEPRDTRRIRYAIRLAVGRAASNKEVKILQRLLEDERARLADMPQLVAARLRLQAPGTDLRFQDHQELAAWFSVTSTILNLDETISQ